MTKEQQHWGALKGNILHAYRELDKRIEEEQDRSMVALLLSQRVMLEELLFEVRRKESDGY